MIPFLIPLLAIGAVAFLVTRRPQPVAPHPSMPMLTSGAAPSPTAPSPLVVLDQLVAAGQTPPPFVVACAIAEAESMGMLDVSSMLFRMFAIPMIAQARAAEIALARDANPMPQMPPQVPQAPQAYPSGPVDPAIFPSATFPSAAQGGEPRGGPSRRHAHHDHHAHARAHEAQQGWGAWTGWPMDPAAPLGAPPVHPGAPGFSHGMPGTPAGIPIDAQGYDVHAPAGPPVQAQPPAGSPGLPSIADPDYGTRVEIVDRPDRPPSRPSGRHAGQGPHEGTITVSGMNSPIADISNRDWTSFAHRVSREQPTFMSGSHLGQYRQNKRRLARLGFDPDVLHGSPELQVDALAADMADAYRHMRDSGIIAEYCGMTIEIPESSGSPVPIEVTLSGIMGVAQAAGIEGAAGWLANPGDRQRFPGTTAAFLRTNGAF